MLIYVDIDGTICTQTKSDYINAKPIKESINKINLLYNEGNTIIYWTARGGHSKTDWTELTTKQLEEWGCLYHKLVCNEKPSYDLLICDKTKRIEEI
jgi:hypothetical protein